MINSMFAQGPCIWNTIEDNINHHHSYLFSKKDKRINILKDINFFNSFILLNN